ncbi:MAG: hypothetical protein C4325_12460, partial [Blastocatellia bacterium]
RLAGLDSGFRKLHLHFEPDQSIGTILADSDQLQQVFLNLFLNARDAMPKGGRLDVRLYREGNFACVRIE